MYVKNLDEHPKIGVEYLGLRKGGKYWFPHSFKYLAWLMIVGIIGVSSVVLIYYGMAFGMIKTYLWITGIITSFLIGIIVTSPVRIFFLSLLDSLFLKRKPVVVERKVLSSYLTNYENFSRRKEIEETRDYNRHLYAPKKRNEFQNRLEDIKFNIELRNLSVDIISYVFFMATVFYVVLINKTEMGFYSTEVMKNLVVKGSYTNSIPFTEVTTYATFLKYLNETLLPSLLLNYEEYGVNQVSVFQRSWTMDSSVKLVGKLRLRQIRVKTDSCKQLLFLNRRNLECAEELGFLNEEKGSFSLSWNPLPSKALTSDQATPWIYKTGWETGTLPVFAQFSSYPSGGYILNFAKNIEDSRIILTFLDSFQWVDVRTRVVFIEFTAYCANTNLFNVVTLIAEKSATGYIIPNYQIETCKFTFLLAEVKVISIVMTILFALLLFFFLLREGLRIHRTSIKLYLRRIFAVLDMTIIILGTLSVAFIVLRSIYVSNLLKKLELSANNDFVSFFYAAYWHMWSVYVEALLICLASFKLFRLLTFRVLFFQLQTALTRCYKHFIYLVFQVFVLMLAFAFFFYLILLGHAYGFSSFNLSFSTMIGRAVALDDNFDFGMLSSSPWYLGPLFFGIFVIVITILFVNLFIAVICLYFHGIRSIPFTEKYNIARYLKYAVTLDKNSDILPLRNKNAFRKKESKEELNPLRLKGGGNQISKEVNNGRRTARKKKKAVIKEEKKENIDVKEFVVTKPYEIAKEQEIPPDRTIVMKCLTSSILSKDMAKKKMNRATALKGMFLAITSTRKQLEAPEKYFFVVKGSDTEVISKNKLPKMKEIVENFGAEKFS